MSRRVSQDARPVGFSVPHAPIFLGAYSAVWLAELAGDKTLCTIGVVAARFWPASLMCGCGAAFMAKMLAAVLTGGAIARLPPTLVAGSWIAATTARPCACGCWSRWMNLVWGNMRCLRCIEPMWNTILRLFFRIKSRQVSEALDQSRVAPRIGF